jgi:hypothetical protein
MTPALVRDPHVGEFEAERSAGGSPELAGGLGADQAFPIAADLGRHEPHAVGVRQDLLGIDDVVIGDQVGCDRDPVSPEQPSRAGAQAAGSRLS